MVRLCVLMYCTVLYRCEMSLSVLLDPTWPQFSSPIPFRTEPLGTGLLPSKFFLPLLNVSLDSRHLSHSLHPNSGILIRFPDWLNLKGCSLGHQPSLCSLLPLCCSHWFNHKTIYVFLFELRNCHLLARNKSW